MKKPGMRFSRRQWIEKIAHTMGVVAYLLVVFLSLALLAGGSAVWLAVGGGSDLLSGRRFGEAAALVENGAVMLRLDKKGTPS